MSDQIAYVMLMASLPRPDRLFKDKQPPLSRLKLDQRLRVLAPEDAATLELVEEALSWDRYPISLTDEQVLERGRKALSQIENETIANIVRDRLELRTVIAALRRRHRGEPAPAVGTRWGFGRWIGRMAASWNEPTLGLDRIFPWVREADQLMKAGDTFALERLILEQAWKIADRHVGLHEFDFEAVVIYVLKWNIVDRWSRYVPEEAATRFHELTDAAMSEHQSLFERGQA